MSRPDDAIKRLEDLFPDCGGLTGAGNDVRALLDYVAELEAGVDKALIQISGGLTSFSREAKHVQLEDAEKTLQNLAGNEGPQADPNHRRPLQAMATDPEAE
jgi:hypothetical protein